MISINDRFLFLNYRRIWFAASLPEIKKYDFISLRQYSGNKPEGWEEKKFTTLFIDLSIDENTLFKNIAKNTRYKINRAEREGVITSQDTIENFRYFFNNFAPSKGLKKLSKLNIKSLKPFMIITKSELKGTVLAMHAYLIDKECKRVRLLYSATINRKQTDIDLNLMGRANRLLHWKDILTFKNMKLAIYDWGGIAGYSDNPETSGIDAFKQSFGGYPVIENHYESPNLTKLRKILRR